MPPKARFTRKEIVNVGMEITGESGIDAVTAAEISKRLGTSVSPIFTKFSSLDEIREEIKNEAWEIFDRYLRLADDYNPAFKMRGMQLVRFAQERPQLFRLLFMREGQTVTFDEMMKGRLSEFSGDILAISNDYNVTESEAERIFNQLWVHCYGICVLCVTKICSFSDELIAALLGETFAGLIMLFKSGNADFTKIVPAAKGTPEGDRLKSGFPSPDPAKN